MQEVVEAIRSGRCVIFCGAGVSLDAGLPDWLGLTSELYKRLAEKSKIASEYRPIIEQKIGKKQIIEALELIMLEVSRKDVVAELRQILIPKNTSKVYDALKKLKVKGFVTTNYDRLLDGVIGTNAYRLTNSLEKLKLVPTAVTQPETQFLLKLHGDIDDELPPDDIEVSKGSPFLVLSKADYAAMVQGERGESLRLALHSILQQFSILFMGCSLSDPDIRFALDFLNRHCQFPHTSWFVIPQDGSIPTLPSNVKKIEPIKDWSELFEWLEKLSESIRETSASSPEVTPLLIQVPDEEKQALQALGEYIIELESGNLFSKTIVSIMVPELLNRDEVDLGWLTQFIGGVLEIGPGWAEAFSRAALSELIDLRLIRQIKDSSRFEVVKPLLNEKRKKANSEWQEDRKNFFSSVRHRFTNSGTILDEKFTTSLDNLLQQLCMGFGRRMAEWVTSGIGREIGLTHVQELVSIYFKDPEDKRKVTELLCLIFDHPADDEIGYIYRLLSSAFLLNSIKLDPTASKFLKKSISQYQLYLDANVLLPLVVKEHKNHNWVSSIITASRTAGAQLFVLEDIWEEVIAHRQIAKNIYNDYKKDLEALALYLAVNGERANCFIQGYLSQRALSWIEYMKSYENKRLEERLKELGITIVRVQAGEMEPSIYKNVLLAIAEEWGKKFQHAPRHPALNKHEAKQFLHIYSQRFEEVSKGRSADIWFLSSETVFEKVYLRNPQKWGKPPTFPVSAWVSFLDSRLTFEHTDKRYILTAILQGNSAMYSMPNSINFVTKKAFGDVVLSKEQFEAVRTAFSDGKLLHRIEKARTKVIRRSSRDPSAPRELEEAAEALVAEIKDDLNEQIKNLKSQISQLKAGAEEAEGLREEIKRLKGNAENSKKRKRKGKH